MADFDKNRFTSKRQDWETPDNIFKPLNDEFHFTLDIAANLLNHKVDNYFSFPENNAMLRSWGGNKNVCWLNPPYGEGYSLKQWVKKAFDESQYGATVVMLIPARTNTEWFHLYCLKHGEVRFIKGRPIFKGCKYGLPQPLCVVIFRPKKVVNK